MTLQRIEARTLDALRDPRQTATAMQAIADTLKALLEGGALRWIDIHNAHPEFATACRQILLNRIPRGPRLPEAHHPWLDEQPRILLQPIRDVGASAGKRYVGNPFMDGARSAVPADSFAEKVFVLFRAHKTYALDVPTAIHLSARLVGCARTRRMLLGKSVQRALPYLAGNSGPAILAVGFSYRGVRYETASDEERELARAWGEWSAKYHAATNAEQGPLCEAFMREHGNPLRTPKDAPGEIGDAPSEPDAPEPVQPRRGRAAA